MCLGLGLVRSCFAEQLRVQDVPNLRLSNIYFINNVDFISKINFRVCNLVGQSSGDEYIIRIQMYFFYGCVKFFITELYFICRPLQAAGIQFEEGANASKKFEELSPV